MLTRRLVILQKKIDISLTTLTSAFAEFPRIFAACSFGKDSRVIIDLSLSLKPDLEFIGIDTGYEFPETLNFADKLVRATGMNFRWIKPSTATKKIIDQEYNGSFIKNGQYKCCAMKLPAIEELLSRYQAWITGLRRDETEYRKNTKLVESGRIVKVNPLAHWTNQDIWQYIHSRHLAYHPLYDLGFTSLGCQPCTTKGVLQSGGGRQGRFERAGRLSNTHKAAGECGLHLL
ncbi:hypothetical protein A3A66_00865 [Microgenomates group bacterium RIFCSPLOWO2_01_FULL_46_13]|nr:MAG: hypothetical protein A2783_02950 [Microgenomates group bacterium RIFCSPHIGHO2_01_FULL_45_11]OGV94559.1 MAG: hypothetical protein A3A66_00865 [Microgenomates group bacterium RIFCSPLOWO2_01_FULL_46_13]